MKAGRIKYLMVSGWWVFWIMIGFGGTVSGANPLDILIKDFSPIEGYVVTAENDDYVIDLGRSAGIHPGDYFGVLAPGKTLVHPISKEAIGRLDTVKNVLKVTRIHEGYAYARALEKAPRLKSGEPIRRYAGVPVFFQDYTGRGQVLWRSLQHYLPELDWQAYLPAEKGQAPKYQQKPSGAAGLFFILVEEKLRVYSSEQILLHTYDVVTRTDGLIRSGEPEFVLLAPPIKAPPEKSPKTGWQTTGADAVQLIGRLPHATKMADFFQIGDNLLLATTDGDKITVFNVSAKPNLLATKQATGFKQILALKWWQPDQSVLPYLAVVMWGDNQVTGAVYVFKDNRLERLLDRSGAILSTFDLDGDRQPETLLSQQFDPDSFFGQRIYRLDWNGRAMKATRFKMALPLNFTATGSQILDFIGDSQLESVYVRKGVLNVFSGHKSLYKVSRQMGGSLSVLTYEKDPSFKDYMAASVFFEIAPIVLDVDNDGQRELVAVTSDYPAVQAPGISVTIKNSALALIDYEQGRFVKKTLIQPTDLPVQGLGIRDNQIIYLVSEPPQDTEGSSSSYLYVLQAISK